MTDVYLPPPPPLVKSLRETRWNEAYWDMIKKNLTTVVVGCDNEWKWVLERENTSTTDVIRLTFFDGEIVDAYHEHPEIDEWEDRLGMIDGEELFKQ